MEVKTRSGLAQNKMEIARELGWRVCYLKFNELRTQSKVSDEEKREALGLVQIIFKAYEDDKLDKESLDFLINLPPAGSDDIMKANADNMPISLARMLSKEVKKGEI